MINQINTSNLSPDIEGLWQIAKEVAETDSTCDGEEDIHGIPTYYFCPFCGNDQSYSDRVQNKDFPHHPNCIVTKARALMEWRKQQTYTPTISVELDGKVIAEHVSTVDVRKLLREQEEKERERRILLDMAYRNCKE